MERYNPKTSVGLTKLQVNSRIYDNLVNYDTTVPTKTIKQIIKDNAINIFNIVNCVLAVIIIISGLLSKINIIDILKNITFMGIMFINTIISTLQEIMSKKTVDKLSVISATQVLCIRESVWEYIGINDIVLDDILKFKVGNQVVVDSIVLEGFVEVNESFITGESKSIHKEPGDKILSGSFIVSGEAIVRADAIGVDNYTSKISKDAKYIKKVNSELMNSLNWVIRTVSKIIIPLGIIMFIRQYNIEGATLNSAAVATVASLIMMIPEGLVLLTSTVLAVSVMRLGKEKVLVQELYCIETLARVDTLCLDKTGTLTEGCMEVYDTVKLSEIPCGPILSSFGKNSVSNPTMDAIKKRFNTNAFDVKKVIEFSSEKKFSGLVIDKKTYILGAPEFVLKGKIDSEISKYMEDYRVLVLTYVDREVEGIVNDLKPICLVLLRDKVRDEAKSTLSYFKEQDVTIKIISGDSVKTVSKIASRLGVINADKYIDMSEADMKDIDNIAANYTIFGRVSPVQKKELVIALKKQGHVVAMTGDGVNDVLSLKEADCSVAMASGSDAAKSVSQLVLLDSNFDAMPHVVLEGRRTINNITRSATLFLSKTGYAFMLAVIYLIINSRYPFDPIQISLVGVVTIGIPSFILALEPNKERISGTFLKSVLKKSVPVSLTVVICLLLVELFGLIFKLPQISKSTLDVIIVGVIGFMLIYRICIPFNLIRKLLFSIMIITFIVGITFFKDFFALGKITVTMFILLFVLLLVSYYCFKFFNFIFDKIITKIERRKK